MFLLNIGLPLIGFLSVAFFGYKLGEKWSMVLTTSLLGLTMVLSLMSFYKVALLNMDYYLHLGTWIQIEVFSVEWGFQFDTLTAIMLCVVTIVSFLVHLYSCSYMATDPHVSRFMSYLSLFTFFMLILICSDNFIVLFLGWEGVGLCSYLLITFWYTRLAANKAAIKAMVVNRVGDVGVLLGVLALFDSNNSINFDVVFALAPAFSTIYLNFFFFKVNALSACCFFLFIGSIGKSAQLGLHTWLPDAMEGPTPVSALIHAATMVTAGVFLIIRCSPLFEYAQDVLLFVTLIGSLTAFFGATVGLVQNDLKKVIAYSTCSQLGYMVFSCGLSNYAASLYHLVNHAFFKALLFLSAGALIHGFGNIQDMRLMGNFQGSMKGVAALFTVGNLALIGFPFFSGAYSKDVIIETAYSHATLFSTTAYILSLVAAMCTALYSTRLFYMVFISAPKQYMSDWRAPVGSGIAAYNQYRFGGSNFYGLRVDIHGLDNITKIPLTLLVIGSLFSGHFFQTWFSGQRLDFFKHSILILPENLNTNLLEIVPYDIKLIPTVIVFCSVLSLILFYSHLSGFFLYLKKEVSMINLIYRELYLFLSNAWYFNLLYDKVIMCYVFKKSETIFVAVDEGFLELFGAHGLVNIFSISLRHLRKLFTGNICDYIIYMVTPLLIFALVII